MKSCSELKTANSGAHGKVKIEENLNKIKRIGRKKQKKVCKKQKC